MYRAEQPALERGAVVKLLKVAHGTDPDVVARFTREAQLASRLDHPYAAHVALCIAKAQETDVFGGGRAWAASNLQLDRDAMALLVVIWAQLILPKRASWATARPVLRASMSTAASK